MYYRATKFSKKMYAFTSKKDEFKLAEQNRSDKQLTDKENDQRR